MRSHSARRVPWGLDAAGLGVVGLLAVVAISRERVGGDSGPLLALLAATVGAVVIGRLLGATHRAVLPLAIVGWAGYLLLSGRIPVGTAGPLSGPFRYRNATGAFLVQGAIAGLMLAASVRWSAVRVIAVAVAVGFAGLAVSAAAAAGGVGIVVIAGLAFAGARGARWAVVLSGLTVAVALAATVVLGLAYRPGATDLATRALTERRIVLWHDALDILDAHPAGVGPGRFYEVSPTAIGDVDARWAHNGFLQQGAELGWAGLILTVLLFVWGFARLAVHPSPDLYVALGAAALAALGIHACVDYVLHFPAIPLACVALVGSAQAAPIRRSRRERGNPSEESIEGGGDPDRLAQRAPSR